MNKPLVHPQLSEPVARFLGGKHQAFIGGKWVDAASGKTFETYDPSSGRVIANVAACDAVDVDRAVAAARAAFESGPWPTTTGSERARMMWRLAELIEKHADELTELESINNGKPLAGVRNVDLMLSCETLRYTAGWATKITGETLSLSTAPKTHAFTVREPIGVVGQIIPWNSPIMMACWKLAPALATGCTVVLKPAEQTPLTALRLARLIQEAGIPDGVVNIVPGFGETAGAAIAAHPDIDKVAFTGSGEVGRLIIKAAAGNLKKVSLELGGKSPVVIFPDADMGVTGPGAARAIFTNSGQVCAAGSRLYAHTTRVRQSRRRGRRGGARRSRSVTRWARARKWGRSCQRAARARVGLRRTRRERWGDGRHRRSSHWRSGLLHRADYSDGSEA